MESTMMNGMEILLVIALIYGVLKYWKWKLQGGYDVDPKNKAYGIFVGGQVLTIFLMLMGSIDPQISAYLEGLSLFGEGAFDFWTVIGVQLFGIVLLFMLSNVIGHLLFNITLKEQDGLHEEIKSENTSAVIIAAIIILVIGYSASYFVLRPYIFDWINSNAGLTPIY